MSAPEWNFSSSADLGVVSAGSHTFCFLLSLVWLSPPFFTRTSLEMPPALPMNSVVFCNGSWICGRATDLFPQRPPLQVLSLPPMPDTHRRGMGAVIAAGGAGWKEAVGGSCLYMVLHVLGNHGFGPLGPFFSYSQSHLSPGYYK